MVKYFPEFSNKFKLNVLFQCGSTQTNLKVKSTFLDQLHLKSLDNI